MRQPEEEGAPSGLEQVMHSAMASMQGRPRRVEPQAERPPPSRIRRVMRKQLSRVQSLVPPRFTWATVDGPASATLAERVAGGRGTVEGVRRVAGSDLLLCGPSGAGKTSLACGVVNALVERCRLALDALDEDPEQLDARRAASESYRIVKRAVFVTGYRLAKAAQYTPLGQEPELVRQASEATLLVLDDLGTDTNVLRHHSAVVAEILHERHQNALPTIVTTYMVRKEIIEHYGAGIARRLAESNALVLEREGGA